MKDLLLKFIKNKFNIALIIVQTLALICLALTSIGAIFVYLFVMLEGVFFILWGIKGLNDSRKIFNMADQYAELPLTTEQKNYYRKKDLSNAKSTKSRAVMLIILGAIVLCLMFSL